MSIAANLPASTPEVVLLGASISEEWHVEQLAERVPALKTRVTAKVRYEFDKGPLLDVALAQPIRPRAVIIKECGAYFPGDLSAYQAMVKTWVARARAARVEPVLATTLPVTLSQPTWIHLKQLIKRYVLQRDDYVDNDRRLRSIWAFNDWLRGYAAAEHLRLLDLEATVTSGTGLRVLPDAYTSGDGLHLNALAYKQLDAALASLLASLQGA